MSIKCDKCKHDSIIYQRYSGMHLCKKHFVEDVERKIKLTIRKHYSVKKNETIAVAISGGKDSSVLLYMLHKILGERPDIRLVALSVDEGIEGYRHNTLEQARGLANRLGVEHIVLSFKEEYDRTMDEIAAWDREKGTCSYCGVLRKSILNRKALELGATKLAIGHNLDDEAQTIMLNHFKGDVARMVRLVPPCELEGLVLRIKPLRFVPEKEVAMYAYLNGLPLSAGACPYSHEAMRGEVRELLDDFEDKHPGTKYALLSGFDKITAVLSKEMPIAKLANCRICGQACSSDLCQACKLLGKQ
ncbi:TIGR00269 family protein [uncultured Methanomethylovorans sp.]|uniref:TIGR00269 family protein n=1 Tax=uncultured Methanomethylovorans sp. TaxID=183759 RepID=UPI002AA94C6B|nr:TIGR00269 family protein [uncultured Methanomethylovorans sp.]